MTEQNSGKVQSAVYSCAPTKPYLLKSLKVTQIDEMKPK